MIKPGDQIKNWFKRIDLKMEETTTINTLETINRYKTLNKMYKVDSRSGDKHLNQTGGKNKTPGPALKEDECSQ